MRNLYLDASTVIRTAILDGDDELRLSAIIDAHCAAGGRLVSSILLEVECTRVAIREKLAGRDATAILEHANQIDEFLPIDEHVIAKAKSFPEHIKTLDVIHLASASFVPDCELLTSDANLAAVARANAISTAGIGDR